MTTRHSFDESLVELQQQILRMGSLVENMISSSVESLARQDVKLAEKVIDMEKEIDLLEMEIEQRCLKLIATQQPLAKDLRRITAGFKIITDLERMADYSHDIAKVTIRLSGQPLIKPLIDIPRMSVLAQKMVKDALDAYVKEDVELAYQMCKDDDMVDQIYSQIFRELLTYMMEDPRTISQATYLLFVGRYIERIADHATNIGERVIYLVTGEKKELND
ncbi:phosphate signaling complex protein PhoU [Thermanaerosceptrum fracticalcis]|uniref:Phosphate-specific transport system accessory protein PhoU n=1 Tax=Thermanaerosceptrum fracticalcis TaxID=1712410 RepID=A0A7G6DZ99_THEFR|nr:phosphate signaling complex protein PhoU [Thermanaerosceptrum fracticalcis]QNB45153.1 phosphate signaling complex protein PhoU [Thermanaerosceptrum fracticalcis]